MLYTGPEILLSRWSPATLALTHLVTLGFMTLVMCGAMMQMLPVIGGTTVPRVRIVSTVIYLLLVAGIPLFMGGFLIPSPTMMQTAFGLLAGGFGVFIVAILVALLRTRVPNDTISSMRLAIVSLLITVFLGLASTAVFSWPVSVTGPFLLTNIHLTWGLLGWTGLLVAGVSYQVVPMFQLTPRYPHWMSGYLNRVIFVLLLVWTGLKLLDVVSESDLASWWLLTCIAGFVIFAATTMLLQSRRKRRVTDITAYFWRMGMVSVLISASIWLAGGIVPEFGSWSGYPLVLGVFLLPGFAVSVICGMLYKIVPFLVWFHLQHRRVVLGERLTVNVPNMKKVIRSDLMRRQFQVHSAAVVCLLLAIIKPGWFFYIAGSLLAASFSLLWINLLSAIVVYRKFDRMLSE